MNFSTVSSDLVEEDFIFRTPFIPFGYNLEKGGSAGNDIICKPIKDITPDRFLNNCNNDPACKGAVISLNDLQICLKSDITVDKNFDGIILTKNPIDTVTVANNPPGYNYISPVYSMGKKIECPSFGDDWQRYADKCDRTLGCSGFAKDENVCLYSDLYPLKYGEGSVTYFRQPNIPRIVDLDNLTAPNGYNDVIKNKIGDQRNCIVGDFSLDQVAEMCNESPDCKGFSIFQTGNEMQACLVNDVDNLYTREDTSFYLKDGVQLPTKVVVPDIPDPVQAPPVINRTEIKDEKNLNGVNININVDWKIILVLIITIVVAFLLIRYFKKNSNTQTYV